MHACHSYSLGPSAKLNSFKTGESFHLAKSCLVSTKVCRSTSLLSTSVAGHTPSHIPTYGSTTPKTSLSYLPTLPSSILPVPTIPLSSSSRNSSISRPPPQPQPASPQATYVTALQSPTHPPPPSPPLSLPLQQQPKTPPPPHTQPLLDESLAMKPKLEKAQRVPIACTKCRQKWIRVSPFNQYHSPGLTCRQCDGESPHTAHARLYMPFASTSTLRTNAGLSPVAHLLPWPCLCCNLGRPVSAMSSPCRLASECWRLNCWSLARPSMIAPLKTESSPKMSLTVVMSQANRKRAGPRKGWKVN